MLRHLASPFVVGVGSRFSGQLIAFATVIVAARHLDLAAFGTYALAWAVAVICNSFVFTGLYQALLRSRAYEDERDTFFWLMAAVGALGAVVTLAAGLAAGGTASNLGRAFLALAPIPLFQVPVAWLEAQLVRAGRVRAAASYVVIAEFFAFAVTVAMLNAGLDVGALISGRYAAVLAGLALTFTLAHRLPRLSFRIAVLPGIRGTVLPLWSTTGLGMFSNYGADLILGAFLNPTAVGTYRSGARISMTVSDLLLQPLVMLSWARFTRLEKDDQAEAIRQGWLDNMALAAALFWPIMASVALLAEPLVSVVFGDGWRAAAPVVAVLALARSLRFFSALLEPTLICRNRGGLQLRIRLAGAVLLFAFLLIFGRHGQIEAASAQVLAGGSVGVMALFAFAITLRLDARDLFRAFAPGLALTLACALAVFLTEPMRAAMGTGTGLLATVALLGVLWLAGAVMGLRSGRLVLPAP